MAIFKLTRRELVLGGLGGTAGLALGFWYGQRRERWAKRVPEREQPFSPSVYLAIDTSGVVTVFVHKTEMGQGVHTALPMIVSEELDARWESVRIEQAPANRIFGDQLTGVSTSVARSWDELRQVGAAAREMLIGAAAELWRVEVSECRTESSEVVGPSGRRLGYGLLAVAASRRTVPAQPRLKTPAEYRLVGTRAPRIDVPDKVTGAAVFGTDVELPGLLQAVVARSPVFGGKLAGFEAEAAERIPGVRAVVAISSGVAVVAEDSFIASKARAALVTRWDEGEHARFDDAALWRRLEEAAGQDGIAVRKDGDSAAQLASAAKKIEAEYRVPYLAHANMEPIGCTVWLHDGRADVWAPTQHPQAARAAAAAKLGMAEASVTVHVTLAGTGFGRKVEQDAVGEACEIAKKLDRPIRLSFTREDDLAHDKYRPAALHRLTAALGDDGLPVAWHHKVVSPSILAQAGALRGGFDPTSVEGGDIPYAIAHVTVEHVAPELPVPIGFWRSVGHSHNAFAVEAFVDELAAAAGQDPVAYRRKLVANSPRHLGVLNAAAERARWGEPPAEGRHRGVALHASFGSWLCQIAEISVAPGGLPKVHQVVCAVDCGIAVNPQIIEQQMEGGIAFGLTAALHGDITLQKGGVVQTNFHQYPLLRMSEMPDVETVIVSSDAPPSGIGETAVPPIAPAVVNALFAATGQRARVLPLKRSRV